MDYMMRLMAFWIVLGVVSTAATFAGTLKVENAWVFAVPPGTSDTAAFMRLINPGTTSVRLTGGATPAADRVEPMITTQSEGRTGMASVPAITIPAGGEVVLKPGGDHLMIYGLKSPLRPGQTITLTLTIQPGELLTLKVPILKRAPK